MTCNEIKLMFAAELGPVTVTHATNGQQSMGEPWPPIPEYDFLGSLSPFYRRVYRLDEANG